MPSSDHGSLTCPTTQTTTSGNTTTITSYSCTWSVGTPIGTATPTTAQSTAIQNLYGSGPGCYTGVGTSTGNWNPNNTTDYGGMTCPANNVCSYSGAPASTAKNCTGAGNRPVISVEPGDRVSHDAFGLGTVVEVNGVGDKAQATVDFGSGGTKRLVLRYAPLVKL